MIISSSQLSMDASAGHTDVTKAIGGRTMGRYPDGGRGANSSLDFAFAETLQSAHLAGSRKTHSSVTQEGKPTAVYNSEYVISQAVEALTGTGVQLRSFRPGPFSERLMNNMEQPPAGIRKYHQLNRQQFSLDFMATRVQYESDYMDFSSSGSVVTDDGRTIDFSLDLSIHSTRIVQQSYMGRAAAGHLLDPLVLNFDSGLESLSEMSFLFDMDGDGENDLIPGLEKGSGFLALDIDGDEEISSGRELFGPRSGSGFSDLAVYDHDENNWIDENDPIFSELLVWMNPSGGEQELLSLEEAGVGAISLTNAGTLFNLKSNNNILLGQVSASGIFLTEDGEVKPLQDVKLAVSGDETENPGRERIPEIHAAIEQLRAIMAEQRQQLAQFMNRHNAGSWRNHERAQDILWRLTGGKEPDDNLSLVEKYLLPDTGEEFS